MPVLGIVCTANSFTNIKLSINYIFFNYFAFILLCVIKICKSSLYNGNSVVEESHWPLGFTDSLGNHFTPGESSSTRVE